MLQQRQGPQQGTVLNNAAVVNATAFAQKREGIPPNQKRLVFEVPAKEKEQAKTAIEEATEAAKAAEAAKAKTKALKEKLAQLKQNEVQKKEAAKQANNSGANIQAAENAQRAAAAAVKAAEKAVKAAGETEARTVKVACGELSDAAVDLQQLFVSAVASKSGVHQPTNSVSLDLNGTLRLAKSLARSAATLEELDVTCPPPKFPTLPKLSLTLPNPFGSRTATAAPPPPPPGGPGYTLARLLPRWPGHGGPPHVPPAAEPPQAAAILVATAAPDRPPPNGAPASLRLRQRAPPGSRSTNNGFIKNSHLYKGAQMLNGQASGKLTGAKLTGSPAAAAARRAAGAGEGGGTRRRRTRHRGTRRH